MKSLVGKTLATNSGAEFTVLRKRKSRTFPFFETFYLYDILWRGRTLSIKCNEINHLVNGECVSFIFD